jgi:outer membrane receptor for ferrienterochelin and colicins
MLGFSFSRAACIAAALALARAVSADPADAAVDAASASSSSSSQSLQEIQVVAQRLNEARSSIETQTGASTYTIDSQAIAAMPGGENASLNQVLLQAPDVVQDSFGQIHVRGDHNDLQYRLNGIILPEGISVFSQTLSPWLISSLKLLTGALPAEYGLRTAGVIDLTTNSGLLQPASIRTTPPATTSRTTSASSHPTARRTRCMITRHRSTVSATSRPSSIRAIAYR